MKTLFTALALAGTISMASFAYAQDVGTMPRPTDDRARMGTTTIMQPPRFTEDHRSSSTPNMPMFRPHDDRMSGGATTSTSTNMMRMPRKNGDDVHMGSTSPMMFGNGTTTRMNQLKNNGMRRMGPPILLTIDANGHLMLRGKVTAVTGSVITVTSWGMTFTVETAGAEVAGSHATVSTYAVGDTVGVKGQLDQNAKGQVAASVVRNWGSFDTESTKGMMHDTESGNGDHGMMRTSSSTMPGMNDQHESNMMPPMLMQQQGSQTH